MDKVFKYELNWQVVHYILTALNRVQFSSVEAAQQLIMVTNILQNPLNKEEQDKEEYEKLKAKFEKPEK